MLKIYILTLLAIILLLMGVLVFIIGFISLIQIFDDQTWGDYTTSAIFHIIVHLSDMICGSLALAFGLLSVTDCYKDYKRKKFKRRSAIIS